MPLHTAYTKIHKKVLRATEELFRSRPWSGTDEDICARWQAWADKACDAYGIPHVDVELTTAHEEWLGWYLPDTRAIMMRKWSLITFWHEFRHHMQYSMNLQYPSREWFEADAQAWACSLYHTVRPGAFRRAVASGKVWGVETEDLGPENAVQGPVAPDCELPSEQREAFEQLAESLLESLDPEEDLAALLDELNNSDGAV